MKKILLSLFVIANMKSIAQVITHEIKFSSLQSKYVFEVPNNKSVQIKLIDINRKIYKVEDEKSSEDFNVTLPDALKGIKLPGFIFTLPSPAPKSGDAQSPKYRSVTTRDWADIDNIMKQLVAAIEYRAKKINDAVLFYNEINHLAKDCSLTPSQIIKSIESRTIFYLYNSTIDAHSGYSLSQRLIDTLIFQRKQAEEDFGKLNMYVESYIDGMTTNSNNKIKNAKKAQEEYKEDLNKSSKQGDKQILKKAIAKGEENLDNIKSDILVLKETVAEMKEHLAKAKDIVEAMLAFEKEDKLYPIHTAYNTYTNLNNYEYTSVIFNPDKDETKLTLTITPVELNACTAADKKSTEIRIRLKGGLKLDVSSGAFVNGGNENFLGSTFYYEKLTADTRQIITAKRNNSLMLSVGALLHLYKRSPSKLKFAGSLGVSTTADFTDLNFHVGPSLIIGDKNRFILTSGLTLKSSKVLDRQLELNKDYKNEETPDDIPTVSVFPKAGWFIGFTYNINILK